MPPEDNLALATGPSTDDNLVTISKAELDLLRSQAAAKTALSMTSPQLVEAAGRNERKLDLGCGLNPKEGCEGVDIRGDKAKHKVDLFTFPWPFEDESIDEIHTSHFMEHIPADVVRERDIAGAPHHEILPEVRERFLGQDMLFAFMDECYRILKPRGWMFVTVPSGRSVRGFMDPTHRRFFMQETFLYFNRDWRKLNGLEHYIARCHFAPDFGFTMLNEEAVRAQPVQDERVRTLWNIQWDIVGKMQKDPPPMPTPPAT